jgi:hypothetical protein
MRTDSLRALKQLPILPEHNPQILWPREPDMGPQSEGQIKKRAGGDSWNRCQPVSSFDLLTGANTLLTAEISRDQCGLSAGLDSFGLGC